MPTRPRPRGLALRGAAVLAAASLATGTQVLPAPAAGTVFSGSSCLPTPGGDGIVDVAPERTWWGERLHLDELARAGVDGRGVTIAVIDTGVDVTGTWFLDRDRVPRVEDLVPPDPRQPNVDTFDCTHGTAVAALIVGDRAARSDEGNKDAATVAGTDYRGVAPGARVVALRALPSSTAGDQDVGPVVAAVRRAIELKVDVINISQESYRRRADYQQAVQAALDAGIVVVAAAGNNAELAGNPSYPASFPGVIAVGMADRQDLAVTGSGWAPDMPIAVGAPGDEIALVLPGTWPAGRQLWFGKGRGTSYAAPLVSGTVALMLQRHPDLTPAQVKDRLMATADRTGTYAEPQGGQAAAPQLGAGVVNPWRAVMAPVTSQATPPPVLPPRGEEGLVTAEPPDHRARDLAVALAASAAALAGLALVLARTLPLARRRGFRPADTD